MSDDRHVAHGRARRPTPRFATFYTVLGGSTEQYADDDWITLETGPGGASPPSAAPATYSPRSPDPAHPHQAHLDLRVPDLDAGRPGGRAERRAAAQDENWYTLADPAGHPFDLLFPAKQQTTLMGVMLDCPDAEGLSTFYAIFLGKPVTYEGEGVAMIGEGRGAAGDVPADHRVPRARGGPTPRIRSSSISTSRSTMSTRPRRPVLKLGATSLSSGAVNWRVPGP